MPRVVEKAALRERFGSSQSIHSDYNTCHLMDHVDQAGVLCTAPSGPVLALQEGRRRVVSLQPAVVLMSFTL